jgi:dihydroxyacetone kinase-like predicted kinase
VEAGSEFRDQADERRLTVVRFAPEEAKQTASNIRTWPEALEQVNRLVLDALNASPEVISL